MIKTGDKVKFLNDVGGGIVKGFAGKYIVYVENEDGFEIPYPVSQLVNVSELEAGAAEVSKEKEQVKRETKEPEIPEQEPGKIIKGKDRPDFYFCLVPEKIQNPVEGGIGLFLVNDSNYTVLYRYAHFSGNRYTTRKHGEIKSNSRVKLEELGPGELNNLPEFAFQLLFFMPGEDEWQQPVLKRFRVNPVKFYKESSFQSNSLFDKNAMIFQITGSIFEPEIDKLTEADFKKVVMQKASFGEPVKIRRQRTPELVEIDLHISELVEKPEVLTRKEILDIQLEKVESEMKQAIRQGVRRIVFIHGVGQGVLKQEVINLLKKKFKKYDYQDASFREYGYGATMVMLRK